MKNVIYMILIFIISAACTTNPEPALICMEGRFIPAGFQVVQSTDPALNETTVQLTRQGDIGRHYVVYAYQNGELLRVSHMEPLEIDPSIGALNGCDIAGSIEKANMAMLVLLVFVVAGILWLISTEYNAWLNSKTALSSDTIQDLFARNWNGQKSNRVYAWYLTIKYMHNHGYSDDEINLARQMLRQELKQQTSHSVVTSNGRIIQVMEV